MSFHFFFSSMKYGLQLLTAFFFNNNYFIYLFKCRDKMWNLEKIVGEIKKNE